MEKAAQEAAEGRKLVIYERTTGLLAYWYVMMRGAEECARAGRYRRPLSLLLIEPSPGSNDWAVQGHLASWLSKNLRSVDVCGYLGNGRYVVLMPETEETSAKTVLARIRSAISGTDASLSSFPEDGGTFEEVYESARKRLSESVSIAA